MSIGESLRHACRRRTKRGRKSIDRRRVLDATPYWNRTCCQWRHLPKEFSHLHTVYGLLRNWQRDVTWQQANDRLHEMVRKSAGMTPAATVAIIDNPSMRSAEGGKQRRHDRRKKVTGHKQHIAFDSLSLLLLAVVHSPYFPDYEVGHFFLNRIIVRIKVVLADWEYDKYGLPDLPKTACVLIFHTVYLPDKAKGFVVLPQHFFKELRQAE